MIARLRGSVVEIDGDSLVVDVGGLGYQVYVSAETVGSTRLGQEVNLSVFEVIKEECHDLYGFKDKSEKVLFKTLLSVNGVGAKMGLSLLNVGSLANLKQAIVNGDVKYIQQANGVGKRLAERLVVELKGKLGQSSGEDFDVSGFPGQSNNDAVSALVALGYSHNDAVSALAGVDSSLDLEAQIKQALGSIK